MRWWWEHAPRIRRELRLPGEQDRQSDPRILISLDRSWKSRLRISPFLFSRLIRRSGGTPLRVDYGTGPEPGDLESTACRILDAGDALILTGGNDVDPLHYRPGATSQTPNPRRDRFELALIREARSRGMPILGICRGCQLLNVAFGGTLRDIREVDALRAAHHSIRTHPVRVLPGTRLAGLVDVETVRVRCTHGQVVDELGDGLRVAARADDQIPESIEHTGSEWAMGVQWHPEFMWTARDDHRVITALVRRARGTV